MPEHPWLRRAGPILADGATGTYLMERSGGGEAVELLVKRAPSLVREAHAAYVEAGAKLLRTNTFSLCPCVLEISAEEAGDLLLRAVSLAREAGEMQARVALSMGPNSDFEGERVQAEQLALLDVALSDGVDCFWLETFSQAEHPLALAAHIKAKAPNALVAVSYCCTADGHAQGGRPIAQVLEQTAQSGAVDVLGLNCGLGPTHMYNLLRALPPQSLPLSAMPNAGYPALAGRGIHYSATPDYFAQTIAPAKALGVRILGGCCGTTPAHIAALAHAIQGDFAPPSGKQAVETHIAPEPKPRTRLSERLLRGEIVALAELDPPKTVEMQGFLDAAYQLQVAGFDALTIPDAPMGRARMSGVVAASIAMQRLKMETLLHICCRDRNENALRGDLLGAHAAGIRAVLAVTGDPMPKEGIGSARGVFHLSSRQLARMIQTMNEEVFPDDPFLIGVAFSPDAPNPDGELRRLETKQAMGASFALTQPVFSEAQLAQVRRARETGMRIIVGVLPLLGYRNAHYMHHEVPGITLTQAQLDAFTPEMDKEEGIQRGLDIAEELALAARADADGFYFIAPFRRADILSELYLRLRRSGCFPS